MNEIEVMRDRAAKLYASQFKGGRAWEDGLMSYARKDFAMGWDAREALAVDETLESGFVVITPDLRAKILELVEIAESDAEGTDWTDNPEDLERYGRAIDAVRTAFRLPREPAQEG